MWAAANNSLKAYSHRGSFIARPDVTIAKKLGINRPGMLAHNFSQALSKGGWIHNLIPMQLGESQALWFGKPSDNPRQRNHQSEP